MVWKKKTVWLVIFLLSGCSGQKVYVWEKPETGVYQFAKDHDHCMKYADFFPWKLPTLSDATGQPKKLKLRARWEDYNGVWASYIPHKGAEPLTVNYKKRATTVSSSMYSKCMKNLGYNQNYHQNFSSHIE